MILSDYDDKIKDIENKHCSTSDYNKFTNNILDWKVKNRKLVDESDISEFIEDIDLDKNKKN